MARSSNAIAAHKRQKRMKKKVLRMDRWMKRARYQKYDDYRRNHYKSLRGVEGPNVLAPPPTAHTNASFPLLWVAVYALGKNKYFYPGSF